MALVFPQQWLVRTNSLKGLPNIRFDYALTMTVLSRLSAVTVQTIFQDRNMIVPARPPARAV